MSTYIDSEKFKAKIHEMIESLEVQYRTAQQAWRDAAVKMNALQAEYTRAENEWKMAEQRKEALLDSISLIDEWEKK